MKRLNMGRGPSENRTETANPMVRDLEGFLGLGMKEEVVRLARACFTGEKPPAEYFNACLNAVLTIADDLAEWKPLVTGAFARLSEHGRHRARFMMLALHCSLGDYPAARGLLAKRFNGPTGLADLCYALETLQALGRSEEVRRLWPKAVARLESAQPSVDRSMLANGLASSLMEEREWDAAIQLWEGLVDDVCFAESAIVGLVELHLRRARLAVESGFAALANLKQTPDASVEVMLPGNDGRRWAALEQRLQHLRRATESQI